MMPKPLPTPAVHRADLLAEVLALRPEVERILRGDARHSETGGVDDKMQIVLLNVTRHLGDYQPHADGMRPWLSRIAQNVQRDAARSVRRRRHAFGYKGVAADDVIDDATCPERRAAARALLRKVVKVMAEMPEQLRTVLVLVVFGRLDHEQVATELAITVPAVKMRLLRAREYLREHAGTLDDHLAVLAPIPVVDPDQLRSWPRRAFNVGTQFGHLWPALLAGALSLAQFEKPILSAAPSPTAETATDERPRTLQLRPVDTEFGDRQGAGPSVPQRRAQAAPRQLVSAKPAGGRAVTSTKAPTIKLDTTDSFRGGGAAAPDSSP